MAGACDLGQSSRKVEQAWEEGLGSRPCDARFMGQERSVHQSGFRKRLARQVALTHRAQMKISNARLAP